MSQDEDRGKRRETPARTHSSLLFSSRCMREGGTLAEFAEAVESSDDRNSRAKFLSRTLASDGITNFTIFFLLRR